jgi:hypothetical protein
MSAETKRLATVWHTIERLAFKPAPADRDRWLWVYVRTLHKLWGLQASDIPTRRNTGFDATFLSLACDYTVDAPDKYSVNLVNAATDAHACWCLHVDPEYCSIAALCACTETYHRGDIDRHLAGDVERVLDGMLFHTRNHAHGNDLGLASALAAAGGLPADEVRLCGGIGNAYVFLTHLRYQFCLISGSARQAERSRLIDLFTTAIHAGRRTIPAGELFGLRR